MMVFKVIQVIQLLQSCTSDICHVGLQSALRKTILSHVFLLHLGMHLLKNGRIRAKKAITSRTIPVYFTFSYNSIYNRCYTGCSKKVTEFQIEVTKEIISPENQF